MKKSIKILLGAVLISTNLISIAPISASAAAISISESKMISQNQPPVGYVGVVWCTGNGVCIRDSQGNVVGYLNRGDRFDADYTNNTYCVDWRDSTATGVRVAKIYLSTVPA
ncbi:hypothetical protein [Clostridium sp. HBUAS56017]|uniref:hypothetical protein n=1 Tax=Clostridium sp. HBUAS56017 TaxID=2571128 RepID=UPI0011789406|nr:hypothetical protein [Clostridium sp. HBUAS56017]